MGAVAYHVFAGKPPAESYLALSDLVKEHKGLDLAVDLESLVPALRDLVRGATRPLVDDRFETVGEFLAELDKVEEELTAPADDTVSPLDARPGDRLEGGFVVKNRLGSGATAFVLLVAKDGQESILKIANGPENNDAVRDEGEVLRRLRHENIVECFDVLVLGGLAAIHMRRAGEQTLADRLRQEGPLLFELLDRFGRNLLEVVAYLEREGAVHRDIKPDNLGIAARGNAKELQLVLFDFSLSRAPADNIRAGTLGYIDPFLKDRRPRRWDDYAERWSAAMTLYEMATGTHPVWGDGHSDPAMIDAEATIEAERFEPPLRSGLGAFFEKAFCRDPKRRFDNAEDMLRAWARVFDDAQRSAAAPAPGRREPDLEALAAQATLTSNVIELPFSARALSALDRLNVQTVEELLRYQLSQIRNMRGVGEKTRREIVDAARLLRQRFPTVGPIAPAAAEGREAAPESPGEAVNVEALGLDEVVRGLLPARRTARDRIAAVLLGLDADAPGGAAWPTQTEVAERVGLTPGPVSQSLSKARDAWRRNKAVSALQSTLVALVDREGGVLEVGEAAAALLLARGSVEEEPRRTKIALAALRAAVEVEIALPEPRLVVRRVGPRVLIASALPEEPYAVADYAVALGRQADRLALLDPLPAPTTVLERLRAVRAPEGVALPDSRLVRLAALAAAAAAASPRLEIYPRGLPAGRALRLSQSVLFARGPLTPDAIAEAVASRYPEAQRLPSRPELDALLDEVGLQLDWKGEIGVYEVRGAISTRSSVRSAPPRRGTSHAPLPESPELAQARAVEERIRRAVEGRTSLALIVPPRDMKRAEAELLSRFGLERLDLDRALIDAMREVAAENEVSWDVVLQGDAAGPGTRDWERLLRLVELALPRLRARLAPADPPLLLVRPGLLARYRQIDLLREVVCGPALGGTLRPAVVLIAGSVQANGPLVDGEVLPVVLPSQWSHVPAAWIANLHRSRGSAREDAG